ncbi:MAG: hypothetical protein KAT15_09415, partial [Bacteroidales bacterium]|nr:hypothetical protein [Bacteroidales bacterium]
ITMAGWLLFGLFWLLQIPHYLDHGEPVNAVYCVLGFPLFMFLMYHEHLSIQWGDDPASLPFMAGTVGMSAGMYFLIDTFPQVAALFVWLTAMETAGFLSMFGYEATAGGVFDEDFVRVPVFHGEQRGISIILACTAIQSIVIFIAAIWTTRVDRDPISKTISIHPPPTLRSFWQFRVQPILWNYASIRLPWFRDLGVTKEKQHSIKLVLTRKWKAFLITVPTILILNIVRTAGVIYLVYEGHFEFDIAHSYLSRWGSMLVLIILAYLMFDILPELHDNIIGIPMLTKRKKPEEPPI